MQSYRTFMISDFLTEMSPNSRRTCMYSTVHYKLNRRVGKYNGIGTYCHAIYVKKNSIVNFHRGPYIVLI